VKCEAVLIYGDVTGRTRAKSVYHVTFQDDSYKFRMTWSLDLVWRKECLLISNLFFSLYTIF